MHFMRYGVANARRGRVTTEATLNAHPLDGLRARLKRNKRS